MCVMFSALPQFECKQANGAARFLVTAEQVTQSRMHLVQYYGRLGRFTLCGPCRLSAQCPRTASLTHLCATRGEVQQPQTHRARTEPRGSPPTRNAQDPLVGTGCLGLMAHRSLRKASPRLCPAILRHLTALARFPGCCCLPTAPSQQYCSCCDLHSATHYCHHFPQRQIAPSLRLTLLLKVAGVSMSGNYAQTGQVLQRPAKEPQATSLHHCWPLESCSLDHSGHWNPHEECERQHQHCPRLPLHPHALSQRGAQYPRPAARQTPACHYRLPAARLT